MKQPEDQLIVEITPSQIIEIECDVCAVPANDLAALESIRNDVLLSAQKAEQAMEQAQVEASEARYSAHSAHLCHTKAEDAANRALHNSIDAEEYANEAEQFSQQAKLESQDAQQFAVEAGEQAKKATEAAELSTLGAQYSEQARQYRDEANIHAQSSRESASQSEQFSKAAQASEAGVQEDADRAGEYALKAEDEANAALKEAENARGYVKHCEHIARLLEQLLDHVDYDYWVGELNKYVEAARNSAEKSEQQAELAQQLADEAKVSQNSSEAARLAAEAAQARAEAAEIASRTAQSASEAAEAASKAAQIAAAQSETNAAISEANALDLASSAAASSSDAADSMAKSVAAKESAEIAAKESENHAELAKDYSLAAGLSSESASEFSNSANESATLSANSAKESADSAISAFESEKLVSIAHDDIVIRHEDIISRQQDINNAIDTGITNIRNEGNVQVNRVIVEGDKYKTQLSTISDTVKGDAERAEVAANRAEEASDKAQEAANTVTGYYQDGGGYDASGGVLPAIPESSTIWRIVQGGLLDGVAYGIGDSLVYSTATNGFYKIDNTESVYSVNGYKGVVSLTCTDVSALPDTSTVTDIGGYTVAQIDQIVKEVKQELSDYQTNNDLAISNIDQNLQSYKLTNDAAVQKAQFTADRKLNDALQDGKKYVRQNGQWVEVNTPINWSAPLAVAGQVIINPPYEFDECNVYINGVMQDQERGAYVVVDNRVELASALSEGDHVQVVIGANPPSVRLTEAPQAGQWNTVTSSVHALNGDHLLLDSSNGTFTITLPESPNPGERIEFLEVGDMAEINPIMLNGNGLLIMGHSSQQLETNGLSFSLLYTDSYGWRLIE